MDPRNLGGKVPLIQARTEEKSMDGPEKCVHGNPKGMGCCGYDELAVKPATTRPITFGTKISRAQAKASPGSEPEVVNVQASRPRIMAQAASDETPAPRGIPAHVGAERVPEANMGFASKIKNVFDQPKGFGNQLNEVRMAGQPGGRPRVQASAMGQQAAAVPEASPAPEAPASARVEAVLKREAPPEGLTRSEAGDLAVALDRSIEHASLALAEGEQCIGVDDSVISRSRNLLEGLARFATTASERGRLEIDPESITLIEKVLECGAAREKIKESEKARTMAFVAGGLLVGTIVLVLVS